MTPLEQMTEQFAYIKSMKDEISVIEKDIRINFEKNILNFFKDKGYLFERISDKTSPVHYYTTTKKESEHFCQINDRAGDNSTYEKEYFLPFFRVLSWDFNVRFSWWKSTNQHETQVYWHPDEMSLEEFYEKKLKKVFKLIK